MRIISKVNIDEITPSAAAILKGQGIPQSRLNHEQTRLLAADASALFRRLAQPVFVWQEIGREEFASIFYGNGRNEPDAPAGKICQSAAGLALFIATTGEPVCREISERFTSADFALAAMLDSAASEGAEMVAAAAEADFRVHLRETGSYTSRDATLRFSPGYCGWHIGAQKALFGRLKPGDIGVTLNASFLMQPLKSISGVIVAGEKEIFEFDDSFAFCCECAGHNCRERILALQHQ